MSTLSRLLPPQRALAYGLAPKHATSPKDLGTYSPREILMRKPISAHECLLPCACFGFASLTSTGNKSPPQGREVTLRPLEGSAPSGKPTPHQGSQHPLRGQSLAKLSLALAPLRSFFPSHEHLSSLERVFSLSHSMDCLCVKGGPSSTATREPLPLQALNTPRPCRVTLRHTVAAVS